MFWGDVNDAYTTGLHKTTAPAAVLPFHPNYRLAHPENYLFLLSKKIFSGSKYPKNILFTFEKGSTVLQVCVEVCKRDRCNAGHKSNGVALQRAPMQSPWCVLLYVLYNWSIFRRKRVSALNLGGM